MAKVITKEDVDAAAAKAAAKAVKAEGQRTQQSLKAEIDRVKASDLGPTEKKNAIAHLKNLQATLKAPASTATAGV